LWPGRNSATREIPIIFLTSHAEDDFVTKVRSITRYGYVIKNSGNFVLKTSIEMAFELFEANGKLKRREQELHEKMTMFQALLENSPVHIFFKDDEIRPTILSRNYETMLGMPLDNIIGKTMDDLFPSDLAKSMIADDKRILERGELIQVDEQLGDKFFSTIKFPITLEGGKRRLAGFTLAGC